MKRGIKTILGLAAMAVVSLPVSGQAVRDTLLEKPLPRITGWADNTHYIVEKDITGERGRHPVAVDIHTGTERPYTPESRASGLQVAVADGDIFLTADGVRTQLTRTDATEKNPVLSPDGRWVAFTRDNDLYAIEIATGREVRYTSDGSDAILNGYASWVYYEEILGRDTKYRAFWWSPDSRHIAFYRFDDSAVPVFPIYNSSGQHGFLELTHYPKAGDPNPEVSVGIVPVEGGDVVWADFDPSEDQYFGTPFWRPDGSGLLVQWMPREQNNLKLLSIDPSTGRKTEIYDERQPTWIDWIDRMAWVGDDLLMVRDTDGWEQIYFLSGDGKELRKLTTGNNWKTDIVRIDPDTRTVYYRSNGELSTRTDLYSVRMDGRRPRRLTFGDYTFDRFLISPDGRHLIATYANVSTPSRIALIDTRSGKARDLADSKGPEFDRAGLRMREMVWLRTEDGFELPGCITWPSEMEPGRRYPVIIQIYGGPGAATVFERWTPASYLVETDPVIRIAVDHRGSGHCGKRGMDYMHRNLGKWEMEDYIAWVRWLRENPAVDPDKIMISGGSYGGYITALALTRGAGYFQYGIADYPVTDWMLYDSHYTERYMDHPKDNPAGYHAASVMTYADRYQSEGDAMLLIQHGTTDDNVHMQNTLQLVDALENLDKSFELMLYPNERHGWFGPKLPFTHSVSERFRERYIYGED